MFLGTFNNNATPIGLKDRVMTAFVELMGRFARCVEANDGAALAKLFTPDGVYDDYLWGPHQGPSAIAAMLKRFHEGGEHFGWEFYEALSDGRIGYARYRFSYHSRVPGSAGAPVAFEGMCRLLLKDGLIEHYTEVFDRGAAFVQLGFVPGKVARLLEKYAAAQNAQAGFQTHLTRLDAIRPRHGVDQARR